MSREKAISEMAGDMKGEEKEENSRTAEQQKDSPF